MDLVGIHIILLMLILSVVLFVFAADNKQGWLAVAKTITWTLSAILIWFMLIGPMFTKAIQKLLNKKPENAVLLGLYGDLLSMQNQEAKAAEAYKKSLANDGTTLLLSPDSDFLKYFKNKLN